MHYYYNYVKTFANKNKFSDGNSYVEVLGYRRFKNSLF